MARKKIIIVDDEPLIPILIKELMEGEPDLEVAKIVPDRKEFSDSLKQDSFDAALIDISIGGREGGMELLQMLRNESIPLPSMMLSAHDELAYALKCLQAGARGYVSKNYICTDLIRGLKAVLSGNLFVSGDRGEYILKKYKESSDLDFSRQN